jgi:tRNA pseudouridine38-40 synthase
MPRYFVEVAYKGTAYAGFQIQKNANSIQAEIEKALLIIYKVPYQLTGSSRTDAGVHALQNYFHFDTIHPFQANVYSLNAILPLDIVIKRIVPVHLDSHCRFNAISREYCYYIYQNKNPFLLQTAWHYPHHLNISLLNQAAIILQKQQDFTTFSKLHTQSKSNQCQITTSHWVHQQNQLVYQVTANRFLRGMVKALVGTMLKVGTGKISIDQFNNIINSKDCKQANFSPPSHGLFLEKVNFKQDVFL